MGMTKSTYFWLLMPAFLTFSCLDAEKKGYFVEIDGMIKKLDSLELAFASLPNDSFAIIKEEALKIEKDVKSYFMEDTVDFEFARKMNRLKGIRKGSDFIAMRRSFLDSIFDFQRTQLLTLKEDIGNGSGQRDKYRAYIDEEKENMSVISGAFKDYDLRFGAMRSEYYDIADIIRKRVKPFKEKALQQ
jgi:hypothetical protein